MSKSKSSMVRKGFCIASEGVALMRCAICSPPQVSAEIHPTLDSSEASFTRRRARSPSLFSCFCAIDKFGFSSGLGYSPSSFGSQPLDISSCTQGATPVARTSTISPALR